MDELLPLLLRTVHQVSVYGTLLTTRLAGPAKKYLESNPDLKSVALMLVIAYISLAILNMATRWVVGMVRFAFSIMFWIAVMAGAMWVMVVGPRQTMDMVLAVVEMVRVWVMREVETGGEGLGAIREGLRGMEFTEQEERRGRW